MEARLHIVASCADRKRFPVSPRLRLRAYRGRSVDARFDAWWHELEGASATQVPAQDLYIGPYWSAVKAIPSTPRSLESRLWVASAGYGLVPAEAMLKPYSATFSTGQDDSIARAGEDASSWRRDWWQRLCCVRGPKREAARTLAELAGREPNALIVVLGSPSYVQALEADLIAAQTALREGELLIISGEPGPRSFALRNAWLPSSAELLQRVGGALPALHARVAAAVVADVDRKGLSLAEVRNRWIAVAERSTKPIMPTRTPGTDEEVKSFIRAALRADSRAKHSRLLREYRASGRACEQSRFRDLFQQVVAEARA